MTSGGRDPGEVAPPSPGRVVDASKLDLAAAERAALDLLTAIGADVDRPDLRGTPRRIAASLAELVTPAEFAATSFPNEGHYDELVVVRDIPFHSLCMHHLLPFFGRAHVAYIPKGKVIGLSKIPRLVDAFARRLQVQERMTVQIAKALQQTLHPRGVGVVIEAMHLCMIMRGVEKQHSVAVSSCMLGGFRDQIQTREEFLGLIRTKYNGIG